MDDDNEGKMNCGPEFIKEKTSFKIGLFLPLTSF